MRAVAIRWFLLLAIPWAGLVGVVAVHFSLSAPLVIVVALVVCAVVGVFGMFGLQQILHAVDQLDQERHGLREAYDRARLDSLRDGRSCRRSPAFCRYGSKT